MSEHTRLVAEAFGHWVLAWTLVVLAVGIWVRSSCDRAGRPFAMGAGCWRRSRARRCCRWSSRSDRVSPGPR